MAEACRVGNHKDNIEKCTQINRNENFYVCNVLCVFISLVIILADLTTDILVVAEYCKGGYFYWAVATLSWILASNIIVNIFSLRWFMLDGQSNLKLWLTHGFLVGFIERYISFLHSLFACQNLDVQKITSQRNDLSLLHFLYIFTGTVPQIILQTHAIVTFDDNYHTKVFALVASNMSIIWGSTTYMYTILATSNANFEWITLLLRLIWYFGMLIARITGILIFTVVFGVWTLLPLGLHWIAMTFWIFVQNTTFCPNKVEESIYNVVMGFVYCFCFVNLREGHTRYRLMMFYTLMVSQNFGSLFLFILISEPEQQKTSWSIAASAFIIIGTVLGLVAMVVYYKCFHYKGPLPWRYAQEDIELNNKVSEQNKKNNLRPVRSFKCSTNNTVDEENISKTQTSESTTKKANENADKPIILENRISKAASSSMETISSSIELYTIENTPQSFTFPQNKKIKICSPTELTLKLSALDNLESSIDDLTSKNINSQKRRGICSSDELREDLVNLNIDTYNIVRECFSRSLKADLGSILSQDTDNSNKKTSSDSIDMDLDLSFSDINSSDINTFNENIVQKLCLSALKNIKVGNQDADIENIQRIALDILKEMYTKKDKSQNRINSDSLSLKQRDLETPTENLSVHDYENICAVNIAREAWGLRSWNGYCDIENWLHDGSVVRDRRRDTLTSGSSEISSCVSQDLKNAILTVPSFPKKSHTYSNVFIKFDKSNQEDYMNTNNGTNEETFLAKPCYVDNVKDPNHLEPILEELDDICDVDMTTKMRLNSESSLVATIDEIRKVTITSSPRNVYHRRELWDSPQSNASNIDYNLKRALWKEPSKFDSSNIMESLPEKENILGLHGSKFISPNKDINFPCVSSSLDLDTSESITNFNKNTKPRSISNLCFDKNQTMRENINKSDHNLHDLSNRDIDFLWHLVSENSTSIGRNENLSLNRRTSSMQSLIHKDLPTQSNHTSVAKVSNVLKISKGKPRRKFSILRERFEHKINLNSDEEVLYSDGVDQNATGIVNLKNDLLGAVSSNIATSNCESDIQTNPARTSNMGRNIKEKRSLFMRQVLSPPKFNTKLRHKV